MSSEAWTEPLNVAVRRRHIRTEMRQKVVAPHVIEALRQERAARVKASATMAGHADTEEAATAP